MEREGYKRKIIDYFKKNLVKGYTVDSLKWALINQGYPRTTIEIALEQANKELAEKAPVLKEKPVISYEIIDEYDKPITIKKPWWRRLLRL
jgi:phage tail protein X